MKVRALAKTNCHNKKAASGCSLFISGTGGIGELTIAAADLDYLDCGIVNVDKHSHDLAFAV